MSNSKKKATEAAVSFISSLRSDTASLPYFIGHADENDVGREVGIIG